MQKRYPALHIISLLFKVLAVVVIVVGIILIIVVLSQGGAMSVTFFPEVFGSSLLTVGVVPIILFSLVAALILWGIAEILVCVVDIENNTREMTTRESQPKEIPPAPVAITPPIETPAAKPAPTDTPPEESEEKKAAAMAARKQNIKDILNKRLW